MAAHDFVILSTTDWNAPQFGSRQQIARQLVRRGHRVLFVEPPRSLHSFVSDPEGTRRALGRMGRIRPVNGGPLVYTPPPILPIHYSRWTHSLNQRLLYRYVRRAMSRVGWNATILWTYWPHTGDVLARLRPRLSVYHCVDDFTAVDYPLVPSGRIARLEADQCRQVDLIFARVGGVAESKRAFNPDTHLLQGGVDTGDFDPDAVIVDPRIDELPKPRVGFLGTLDDRLDVTLLKDVAERMADTTFVLVGPVKRHLVDLSALRGLRNVRFLPACPYDDAPAVIAGFDVCVIPYRATRFTAAVSPIKLYEYLAMGKPIVATDLPYVQRERSSIRVGRTPAEFAACISSALSHPPSAQDRCRFRAIAQSNSWERQVDEIERHLARLVEGPA
jgi:glycosyltransferase involved in cell wall biosynthesis